jgi:two-component system OmpR family sensor kinase
MSLLRKTLAWRHSLVAKLGLMVLLFMAATEGARLLSLDRLEQADALSREMHHRWLERIRILGSLNHGISDVRTAEAEFLLGPDPADRPDRLASLQRMSAHVADVMARYAALLRRDEDRSELVRLQDLWRAHAAVAVRVATLSRDGEADPATLLFNGASKTTFDAARDAAFNLTLVTEARAEADRGRAAAAIAEAQDWVSDLMLGTLALFFAITVYVWRAISQPLLRLADRMRRLADYQTDFALSDERRPDEIGAMARALAVFRRNTTELLESRKRLAIQSEALSTALKKERALAVEQRNFITTVSHEFRTPLMAIDGNAQRLIATKDRAKPGDIADRAQRIRSAVFRIASLMSGLSRALEDTGGNLRPRMRRFDLAEMLRSLCRYYREIGIGGELVDDVADASLEIVGDPDLLHLAVSNLLSNGFKYASDSDPVRLRAYPSGAGVEIVVEDEGVGIPRSEIGRIRERYYRASNVGTIPGTGIGLSLVEEIARRHGGRLVIESEEGRGTRAMLALPRDGALSSPEPEHAQDTLR